MLCLLLSCGVRCVVLVVRCLWLSFAFRCCCMLSVVVVLVLCSIDVIVVCGLELVFVDVVVC